MNKTISQVELNNIILDMMNAGIIAYNRKNNNWTLHLDTSILERICPYGDFGQENDAFPHS